MEAIKYSSTIRESDSCWEQHKNTIIQLYMHEGRTLREVIKLMEIRHNFKATPKTYKNRLRGWGCRKNIVLKGDQEDIVVRNMVMALFQECHTSKTLILPNGQLVDADRLARYLRRKSPNRRCISTFTVPAHTIPAYRRIKPPDAYYIPEKLYSSTRAYILGRFEAMKLANSDAKSGANPHIIRWLSFAYGVHVTVVDRRFDDAILCMRKAPEELMNLLLHQPGLVLSNLFRFVTSIVQFLPHEDPGVQQFLKVIKSLFKYGATCLGTSGSACGEFSSTHPLRLVLENLAMVEDKDLLMVAKQAWIVSCLAAFDLMDEIAAANTNKDWKTLMQNGGARELAPNQNAATDFAIKRSDTNRKDHIRLVALMNRAFFLRTLAAATGRDPSLEDSVLEACQGPEETKYNLDTNVRLALHRYFGVPIDDDFRSRLVDFLAASPE